MVGHWQDAQGLIIGGAMLRVILMLLLAVVSSNAMAEWMPFDNGTLTEYADLESTQRSGTRLHRSFD